MADLFLYFLTLSFFLVLLNAVLKCTSVSILCIFSYFIGLIFDCYLSLWGRSPPRSPRPCWGLLARTHYFLPCCRILATPLTYVIRRSRVRLPAIQLHVATTTVLVLTRARPKYTASTSTWALDIFQNVSHNCNTGDRFPSNLLPH